LLKNNLMFAYSINMPSDYPKIDEISQMEKQLMIDINDFNTKYSCYLHSNSNSNPNAKYVTSNQSDSCPSGVSIQVVDAAKQQVIQDINNITQSMSSYRNNNNNITQAKYNSNFQNLIQKYGEILNERKDLDTKLAELYGTDDGINNYYNNKYSATMFSKIMLTILVTSLVYYTFMKLIKK